MTEFNDRRKRPPSLASRADYEKGLADQGMEEVTIAEVRPREGKPFSMPHADYEKWAQEQPKGSHRVSFRTQTRKKNSEPEA